MSKLRKTPPSKGERLEVLPDSGGGGDAVAEPTTNGNGAKGAKPRGGKAPFELPNEKAVRFPESVARVSARAARSPESARTLVLMGDGVETAYDADELTYEELFDGSERSLELLSGSPAYLSYLESLDQDFISPELYDRGQVPLDAETVVLSWDKLDYSSETYGEGRKRFEDAYGSSDAAEQMMIQLGVIGREIRSATRFMGGYCNQWAGDGTETFFCGGSLSEKVYRATMSAQIAQRNLTLAGFKVRVGIDVGPATAVAYGGREKRADIIGQAVDGAKQVQKQASEKNGFIALSEVVSQALETVPEHVNGDYSSDEENAFNPLDWTPNGELNDGEEVRRRIAAREAFMSESMRKQTRLDFVRGPKSTDSRYPVSTTFLTLTSGVDGYERMNEVCSRIFEIVTPFRGKVDKVMGKTIMINNIAWLNELNSVRAAKQIQAYLASEGIDFVMGDGRAESMVVRVNGMPTVLGEGVNRSHRIMTAEDNPANQVVVDRQTADRLPVGVQLIPLPPRQLKGCGEKSVERFIVADISNEFAVAHGREVMGRGRELATLQEDLLAAQTETQVRFVRAAEGNGKSALVGEFALRAQEQGAAVIAARADAYYRNQPFSALGNLFTKALEVDLGRREERQAAVEAFYRNNLPELVSRLDVLNPILDIDLPQSEATGYLSADESADVDEIRAELLAKTLEYLRVRDGVEMPLVMILEDVQFIDQDSEKLMARIAKRFKQGKLDVILTSWKNGQDGRSAVADLPKESWLKGFGVGEESVMDLEGLPVFADDYDYAREHGEALNQWWEENKAVWFDALQAFIDIDRADFLTHDLGYRRIVVLLSQKTGGNFAHLESALAHLTKYRGDPNKYFKLDPETGKYALSGQYIEKSEFDAVPDIDKLQQDKIERVHDPEAQSVFRDAAVAAVFDIDVLELMSGLPKERIMRHVRTALEEGLWRDLGNGRYEYVDPAVANAAYNSLPLEVQRMKHRVIGEYLEQTNPGETATLTRHFRNSDDYLKALKYLRLYVDELGANKAWGATLAQIGHATKIFEKITGMTVTEGAKEGAIVWKDSKVEVLDRPITLDEILANLAQIQEATWSIPDVSRTDGRRRSMRPEEIHECVHGQIGWWLAEAKNTRVSSSNWSKSESVLRRVRALFDAIHADGDKGDLEDVVLDARIHREFGRVYKIGRVGYEATETELRTAEGILDQGLASEHIGSTARDELTGEMSMVYFDKGRLLRSQSLFAEALNEFERSLQLMGGAESESKIIVMLEQAECYENLGQATEARVLYDSVISYCRDHGDKSALVSALNGLSGLMMRLGDVAAAEQLSLESLDTCNRISKRGSANRALSQIAFGHRTSGDYRGARELFDKVEEFYHERGMVVATQLVRAEVVFCSIKLGELYGLMDELQELRESSYKVGRARSYTLEAMMLAERSQGIDDGIREIFQRGIAMLRESHSDTDLAFDLYAMGEYELNYGDVALAKQYLLEAKDIYERTQELVELDKINQLLVRADLAWL